MYSKFALVKIMLSMIMVFSLSCSKVVGPAVEQINLSKIFQTHNKLISSYYSNHQSSKDELLDEEGYLSKDDFDDIIQGYKSFLIQDGYSSHDVDTSILEVNALLEELGAFVIRDGSLYVAPMDSLFINNSFIYAKNNGIFNSKEAEILEPIFYKYYNGEPLEDIENAINEANSEVNMYNPDYVMKARTFISGYNSSEDFWTGDYMLAPGSGTILADGLGFAIGLVGGALGSIVLGTYYSFITNEYEQWHHRHR